MFASNTSQVSSDANYIEDVFSTWLYASTSGTDNQIVNGIDLAGKGGMVWVKSHSTASTNNYVLDTVRGSSLNNSKALVTNSTAAQNSGPYLDYMTFNSNGFTAKPVSGGGELGTNTYYGNFASWTFRKQPKFFDVVTYVGDGVSGRTVAHDLGSVPGAMIIKVTTNSGENWNFYHRSTGYASTGLLNQTNAFANRGRFTQDPTATDIYLTADTSVNQSGQTYVAYLFAHNAGGFGLTGTDNVISCGSFTTDGSGNATVNLGYEPQLVIIKTTGIASNWAIFDTMRGMPASGSDNRLFPNLSAAEDTGFGGIAPTATGFNGLGLSGSGLGASLTYIYIAIRRGPMKVPTDPTKVFVPVAQNAATNAVVSTSFPVDLNISAERSRAAFPYTLFIDRLRGSSLSSSTLLASQSTNAESNFGVASGIGFDSNVSVVDNLWSGTYGASDSISYYNFRRAPGFFDEVCYTGTGSARTVAHNLGVAPELMLVKQRQGTATENWAVYSSALGPTKYLVLNGTGQAGTSSFWWNNTSPTASVFTVADADTTNQSAATYVAYLFASCPGVSKVGSYTGTGTTKQIDCGFTGGARFVLIKRTDSTGDWYVWDSARGIVAGNDPYLLLNSTAAEVTTTDYVDTYSAGFEISSTAPAAINANGGSFIYLAIA